MLLPFMCTATPSPITMARKSTAADMAPSIKGQSRRSGVGGSDATNRQLSTGQDNVSATQNVTDRLIHV